MPTWLGYATAEELAAEAAKKAEKLVKDAEELDKAIKDGTAGRVVNDPDDQKRVNQYRREQAALKKQREADVAKMKEVLAAAKNFHSAQQFEQSGQVSLKQPPKGLGSHDCPEVKAVRQKMESAKRNWPYKGTLRLFTKPTQHPADVVLETSQSLRK